jgi:hypothetical protein
MFGFPNFYDRFRSSYLSKLKAREELSCRGTGLGTLSVAKNPKVGDFTILFPSSLGNSSKRHISSNFDNSSPAYLIDYFND